jgi:hypothetical protein
MAVLLQVVGGSPAVCAETVLEVDPEVLDRFAFELGEGQRAQLVG